MLVLVLSGFFISASAFNFTVNDCLTNHTNAAIRLGHYSLSPNVIHFPGDETGSGDLDVLKTISGHHFRMDVKIEKYINHHFVDLPCLHGYGSCSYDFCTLLNGTKHHHGATHCPPALEKNHFPCHCPIQPGHYSISSTSVHLKAIHAALSSLASGDLKIHVNLTDTQTHKRVACYDIQVTIQADCSGFLCGFLLG